MDNVVIQKRGDLVVIAEDGRAILMRTVGESAVWLAAVWSEVHDAGPG
jgi:hypothetical protein